jgi:hypothetical protein
MKKILYFFLATTLVAEEKPTLKEPAPPKPAGAVHPNWEIKILKERHIECTQLLKNKKEISITVEGYELVPVINTDTLILPEPKFDITLGSQQKATIGAILSSQIESIENSRNALAEISKDLQTQIGDLTKIEPPKPTTPPTPPKPAEVKPVKKP